MDRNILLVDMDAYFASVEQAANPALRGKPVVVCGHGRTIAAAVSYEARAFGVKTAMSLPEVRKLCPAAVYVYGNHDKYSDTSHRIHEIFLSFTDQVEVFSIDECFLDVTYCDKPARAIARAIKQRIKEEIGVSCSIGIGPNKFVAKLASKLEKPDGLVEIKREDIPAKFADLPISALQGTGVGRKLSDKLASLGIHTAGQLGAASQDLLTAQFGIMGYHLRRMGNGEDDSPVGKYGEYEQAKSVGHSHTLPQDTWNLQVIKSYLQMLSEKTGFRLREAGLMGRTVDCVVRYADFTTVAKQHSTEHYIKTGYEIYQAGWGILSRMLPLKKAVRLVGVTVSSLVPDDNQHYLLEQFEKYQRLTETVDAINKKYGGLTVKPSSILIAEKFGR